MVLVYVASLTLLDQSLECSMEMTCLVLLLNEHNPNGTHTVHRISAKFAHRFSPHAHTVQGSTQLRHKARLSDPVASNA